MYLQLDLSEGEAEDDIGAGTSIVRQVRLVVHVLSHHVTRWHSMSQLSHMSTLSCMSYHISMLQHVITSMGHSKNFSRFNQIACT